LNFFCFYNNNGSKPEMDALRVSLLLIGVAIVTGIYFIGRRHLDASDKNLNLIPSIPWSTLFLKVRPYLKLPHIDLGRWRHREAAAQPPVNEELAAEDIESLNHIVTNRSKPDDVVVDDVSVIVELTADQIAPAGEQLFIPVTINGHLGRRFTGEAIMHATTEAGLYLGDDGVYRYDVEDAQGYKQTLLGLANIMEPGTFDAGNMRTFDTPGLVLYLHLPGPLEAREAFAKLIETGRKLTDLLEGEFCDETRSVLTNQTIGHLKEKVEAYRFKQKMTQIKQRRH